MNLEQKMTKLRECVVQIQGEEDKSIWDETLIALLEGVSEKEKKLMKPVLQQQWEYLQKCKKHDRWGEFRTNAPIPSIILPAVRRIFADFPIRNLVGVQPISELVGTVHSLEYRSVDCEPTKGFFGEPGHSTKLEINIVEHKVAVGARKLDSCYTPVTDEDLVHACGINIECEKIQTLTNEIRADITNEVLQDLKKLGGEPEVVKLKGSEDEQIFALGCRIRSNTSSIAMKTRRGAGNWVVVSKTMAKILSKEISAKIEIKDDYKSKNSEMLEVGTMNGVIRIFVADVPDDEILIGYKGTNGECDSGYFYCPHTVLMTGGFAIHPITFDPILGFMTRYGKFTTKNVEAYYRNIKVESDILIKK